MSELPVPSNNDVRAEEAVENEQQEIQDSETTSTTRRRQPRRPFPTHAFEEALKLAEAIQSNAPNGIARRLTLFDTINKSPDSSTSRDWMSSANKYGLIKGSFQTENLELTPEGKIATGEEFSSYERTKARIELAIFRIEAFRSLYEELAGKKFPSKQFIIDIAKNYLADPFVDEGVDIFTVNAKFVGLLQVVAGAERLLTLEHVLEKVSNIDGSEVSETEDYEEEPPLIKSPPPKIAIIKPLDDVCFYITPIGEPGSEQRSHADLFMDHIITPALTKLDGINLRMVRADKIENSGIITSQIIRHLLQSRLVIADLSFHNPNVFYELAIRHASRLPTVHIIRANDVIPFDVNQMRTIKIDSSSIYTLVPRLDTYRAEIAVQIRRALEDDEIATNPITIFYPSFKVLLD